MKTRFRTAFVVLVIILAIVFPSVLQSENSDSFIREASPGILTVTKDTGSAGKKAICHNYLHWEMEIASAQKSEQDNTVYGLSIEFCMFFIFSLGMCLKRIYLSYMQIYSFVFARFLWEYDILLKKDGKKRVPAFVI